MNRPALFLLISLIFFQCAFALDEGDISIMGLELDKLLNLLSGILSAALLALTLMAFRRSGNERLVFVSAAFFLYSVKSFMLASALFMEDWAFIDPAASFLDFAILLSFFLGILRK